MSVYLLTAALDTRYGTGKIASRIGIEREAHTFKDSTDLFEQLSTYTKQHQPVAVLVDEAQWLSSEQVWQMARFVDECRIPIMCYGLRTDFLGKLFPGAEVLLAIADELREIRTICHCGRKATMNLRVDEQGQAVNEGPQNLVGGNDTYHSLCRHHWVKELKKYT